MSVTFLGQLSNLVVNFAPTVDIGPWVAHEAVIADALYDQTEEEADNAYDALIDQADAAHDRVLSEAAAAALWENVTTTAAAVRDLALATANWTKASAEELADNALATLGLSSPDLPVQPELEDYSPLPKFIAPSHSHDFKPNDSTREPYAALVDGQFNYLHSLPGLHLILNEQSPKQLTTEHLLESVIHTDAPEQNDAAKAYRFERVVTGLGSIASNAASSLAQIATNQALAGLNGLAALSEQLLVNPLADFAAHFSGSVDVHSNIHEKKYRAELERGDDIEELRAEAKASLRTMILGSTSPGDEQQFFEGVKQGYIDGFMFYVEVFQAILDVHTYGEEMIYRNLGFHPLQPLRPVFDRISPKWYQEQVELRRQGSIQRVEEMGKYLDKLGVSISEMPKIAMQLRGISEDILSAVGKAGSLPHGWFIDSLATTVAPNGGKLTVEYLGRIIDNAGPEVAQVVTALGKSVSPYESGYVVGSLLYEATEWAVVSIATAGALVKGAMLPTVALKLRRVGKVGENIAEILMDVHRTARQAERAKAVGRLIPNSSISATFENAFNIAPGYSQGLANGGLRKSFLKEMRRLGVQVEFVTEGESFFNRS